MMECVETLVPQPEAWPAPLTDADLMARIRGRDQHALIEIYRRYGRRVYPLIRRIVQNPALAEEVVQDLFMRLWERPEAYSPQAGQLISWLLTVGRNLALDARRRESRRADLFVSQSEETERNQRAVALPPFDGALSFAIRQAIENLPCDQRQALELAYFEGLTHGELASRLGEPLGTVKSRLRLAVAKLREALRNGTVSLL